MIKLKFFTILLASCLFSAVLCHAGEKTKLVANLKSGKQQTKVKHRGMADTHPRAVTFQFYKQMTISLCR